MKVLALEFSSVHRSIAVVDFSNPDHPQVLGEAADKDYRSCTPLLLIDNLLRQAQLSPAEIHALAIGLGPGSYTGIRSAIAIAQGWQLARMTKVAGVSSSRAIAWELQSLGYSGKCQIIIDAQRNEVYLEDYLIEGSLQVTAPLRIASPANSQQLPDILVAGPEATRWDPNARVLFPKATGIATLAMKEGSFVAAAETLEPLYLRATTFVKAPPPRPVASASGEPV